MRGTWHFCSGVPYATHHMALVPTKTGEIGVDDLLVVMFERQQFRRLDNWGDLIGLKGSGSHSVVVDETFVPSNHAVPFVALEDGTRPTTGYVLHGNPLYGGRFSGFAVGRLTSVQVGNAQAAVDEYERLLVGKKTFSITNEGVPKIEDPNYQRCLGLALAWTDSAYSTPAGRRPVRGVLEALGRGRRSLHGGEEPAHLRPADDGRTTLLAGR